MTAADKRLKEIKVEISQTEWLEMLRANQIQIRWVPCDKSSTEDSNGLRFYMPPTMQ